MTMATTRLVTGTVGSNGRVTFNQISLSPSGNEIEPDELKLVAIDPEQDGFHIWRRPYSEVAEHAKPQHGPYSTSLRGIDPKDPPPYLGLGEFHSRNVVTEHEWRAICTGQPRQRSARLPTLWKGWGCRSGYAGVDDASRALTTIRFAALYSGWQAVSTSLRSPAWETSEAASPGVVIRDPVTL
jgi:hypothetical protein